MIQQNFIKIYEESFKSNWELPALSNYKDRKTLSYSQLAEKIARIHIMYEELGIRKGDKVALIGKNHTGWSLVFLATITYGAVIVPILHEFNPESIEHIISHSESRCVFINKKIWENLDKNKVTVPVFSLPSFDLLQSHDETTKELPIKLDALFAKKYPDGFHKENIVYADVDNEEVICLNYTSGTTGFSKGVMLTANNFAGNITYAHTLKLLFRGERDLAFLPMAHAYGCAFDFLYALSTGVHVTLLDVAPSPQNLINAFQEIKPNIIITVPLIFEKIYKKKILPEINKPAVKMLSRTPGLNRLVYRKIRKSLIKSLGGNFREVIIGGAALGKDVEAFFYKIKFPFTVGYGMTECGPLISYDHHYDFVPTSCGSVLAGIMEARIDSPDPEKIPGEIQVRGENVMKGYYKNPEATAAAFTEDGWLKTGDSGVMRGRRLFIKGRIKTMILGPSGQNIYPEEIESKLNNLPYVAESLVIERERKLVALVYPDYEAMGADGLTADQLPQIMEDNKKLLNNQVANYERIGSIVVVDKEFEKTPKKSIKRFLYS
ncbi:MULTISPECIES: AMP-binding protein [Petrimonas]|jgi:long-chain acyl-CoA synthetase|nr:MULTISPECIES: AMP-binding protein [Petrimonas]MDD3560618.1 AMP-binding protein [Petrimonas mucosa]SFU27125.1 long-chain acyl-CoA synthetase [Porphyromonadaceae bacterium KHP3R9]HHT30331.1 long-chain fatty acid--CoA ligase [Petrimonas mucosa]